MTPRSRCLPSFSRSRAFSPRRLLAITTRVNQAASLLSIHAAGHHANPLDAGYRTVVDRVVSSYSPTVGALAHAQTATAITTATMGRSLIVAMPTTPDLPGRGRLTYVPAEAALLQACLPRPVMLTSPSAASDNQIGEIPIKAAALEHLPGSAVATSLVTASLTPPNPSRRQLPLRRMARAFQPTPALAAGQQPGQQVPPGGRAAGPRGAVASGRR
jgi:hypothetical protein